MRNFDVKVIREGRWWMIEIPEIDGLTQARRLTEVEDMARSYISLDQGLAPGSFDLLTHVFIGGENLDERMADVTELRREAAAAEAKASEAMREMAARLAALDVPTRDIGTALGVSHQRVSQLVRH